MTSGNFTMTTASMSAYMSDQDTTCGCPQCQSLGKLHHQVG